MLYTGLNIHKEYTPSQIDQDHKKILNLKNSMYEN